MDKNIQQQLLDFCEKIKLNLSLIQIKKIVDYIDYLIKWNKVYNLTAIKDKKEILKLHIFDCLVVINKLKQKIQQYPEKINLLDVGTGAGLPAVIFAICITELQVDCVDTVGKKIAFINQIKILLNLTNLNPINNRVENLTKKYEIICSRAFSSIDVFIKLTKHLLKENGFLLTMKSKMVNNEISELKSNVKMMFHVEQLEIPNENLQRSIVWIN